MSKGKKQPKIQLYIADVGKTLSPPQRKPINRVCKPKTSKLVCAVYTHKLTIIVCCQAQSLLSR